MEKGTPHCQMSIVKAMIEAGKVRSTMSAVAGSAALGFDFEGVAGVVMALTSADFYKSMTTHTDHRVGCIPANHASWRGLPETYRH